MRAHLQAVVARVCVLLALAGTPRAAEARQAADTRAILTVVLNGANLGESLVVMRVGTGGKREVLVPAALLTAARLMIRETVRIDGVPFVSLDSIRTSAPVEVDDEALELRVRALPGMFAANAINLRPQEPAGTIHTRNASAFANYALNWSNSAAAPAITGEIGASVGTAKFNTTLTRMADGQVSRGITTLTYDQHGALRRLQAGDVAMPGVTLWSGGLVQGVSVARDFGLNPYFVRFPSPKLTQTISTPSTVDVYVNDRLVRRAELPPGVFDVTGVPALNGAGDTRLVIRDAFGRSQEFNTSYYITASVLASGLQDFQYAAGFRRASVFDTGRGNPAMMATHRIGVTDRITLGAHAEADRALGSGGAFLTARPGRIGAVEIAAGASRATSGAIGSAVSAAWSYVSRPISASASMRVLSAGFVSFGDAAAQRTARVDWSASLSRSTRRIGALSLELRQQWLPSFDASIDRSWRRRAAITGSRRVFGGPQLQWRAGRSWDANSASFEASVGLSVGLGGRTMAMVSAAQQSGFSTSEVSLSRPLAAGNGVGARARIDLDGGTIDAAVQAQNRFARYEVQTTRLNGVTTSGATVSGGVVTLGRSINFTNTLGDSFGLVRVPGVKNVRVFSNNVEVGRTDRRGNLLIPALIPNYANRLAISDMDLPGDRSVADAEKLVAPPAGAGAVVTFGAQRIQAVMGSLTIRVDGRDIIPAYGLVVVALGQRVIDSPVAADGSFFLEQLPAGEYNAVLQYHEDEYIVVITVPRQAAAILNVGRLLASMKKD